MSGCFSSIELTTAAVYYYTWGRIPDKLHLQVGWLYAASSFATLVIINGILTFMLTPGQSWLSVAGTGREPGMFVWAFFNPTYWPSLALRTLSCIALAGIWALVTGSRIDGATEPQLKREWIRWSTMWLIPGFVLMPICLWWYIQFVPAQQLQLSQLGISTIGAGTFTQVTRTLLVSVMASATILAVVYLAAYRKPEQFQLGYAMAVLLLGVAATGSAEMSRELLRKPYVVVDYMYSNGIRSVAINRDGQAIREVDRFNDRGYLADSIWVRDSERAAWTGQATGATSAGAPNAATLARGELMFRGQCMACHTTNGYRSMRTLLRERNEQAIRNIVAMLHKHEDEFSLSRLHATPGRHASRTRCPGRLPEPPRSRPGESRPRQPIEKSALAFRRKRRSIVSSSRSSRFLPWSLWGGALALRCCNSSLRRDTC